MAEWPAGTNTSLSPGLGRLAVLDEVRRLGVGLKGVLVAVDLVEVEHVGFGVIDRHVEAQAARLVAHRPEGILQNGLLVLLDELRLDRDSDNQREHPSSLIGA
jgi:hypothetical protein